MKNSHSQRAGIAPLIIIIIIAVAALGGGAYVYKEKVKNGNGYAYGNDKATTTDKSKTDKKYADTKKSSSPKEAYLKANAELFTARTYDEFIAILLKYSSSDKVAQIKNQSSVKLTADQKDYVFNLGKSVQPAPQTIQQVTENIDGNQATLIVTTSNPRQKVVVIMILENGVWKLSSSDMQTR